MTTSNTPVVYKGEPTVEIETKKLTSGTTAFTTTTILNAQTSTISLYTADKYLDKDITITVSAKSGTITASAVSTTMTYSRSADYTFVNATVTTSAKSGVKITAPRYTITHNGVKYTTTEGWVGNTSDTVGSATITSPLYSMYLKSVTLSTPSSGTQSLTLTDSNGTWTWETDANGNTYIY